MIFNKNKILITITAIIVVLFIISPVIAAQTPFVLFESENELTISFTQADNGDTDGDEFEDVLIGIPELDDESKGKVYLFLGKNIEDEILELEKADFVFSGKEVEDHAGTTVAFVEDTDGDGLDEIEIGFFDQHVEIIFSSELDANALSKTVVSSLGAQYSVVVGVSVGASKSADCSLSKGQIASNQGLILFIGSIFLCLALMRWRLVKN